MLAAYSWAGAMELRRAVAACSWAGAMEPRGGGYNLQLGWRDELLRNLIKIGDRMKSSIVDVPRKYSEEDLFGINKYQRALIKDVVRGGV